jgi:hypothetical protein
VSSEESELRAIASIPSEDLAQAMAFNDDDDCDDDEYVAPSMKIPRKEEIRANRETDLKRFRGKNLFSNKQSSEWCKSRKTDTPAVVAFRISFA